MKTKLDKTNAMRKLDAMKLSYREHTYTDTDAISGVEVAAVLGQEPDKVFKTLVTQGKSKNYYVSGGGGTGLEESGQGGRRKIDRNDQVEGPAAADRLCAWRLQPDRHEKVFPDDDP